MNYDYAAAYQRNREHKAIKAGFPMEDPKTMSMAASFVNWYRETTAGVNVTQDNATESSAVFCALQNLALIATLPWSVFRKSADGKTREEATDHQLYPILKRVVNSDGMPTHRWWEWMINAAVVTGNAFSFIE